MAVMSIIKRRSTLGLGKAKITVKSSLLGGSISKIISVNFSCVSDTPSITADPKLPCKLPTFKRSPVSNSNTCCTCLI